MSVNDEEEKVYTIETRSEQGSGWFIRGKNSGRLTQHFFQPQFLNKWASPVLQQAILEKSRGPQEVLALTAER
jgi:hypothetical protein